MSSILDIDLDYFNLIPDPVAQLENLLSWAGRPVDIVVEKHHHVLRRWTGRVRRGTLTPPEFILHVDEHHDMMDERRTPNIGNMMYHAMNRWPDCRVCWLAEYRIDHPGQWLEDETWRTLKPRFRMVTLRPPRWPKPDLVSVCTSPEFVHDSLLKQLTDTLAEYTKTGIRVAWRKI
jgi:hypothetical protein